MSAKVDIWMPLYVADYLSATSRLTTEQHGAYLLLLMDYWKNGPPPDNDGVLAQITRLSPVAWSNARTMLEPMFQVQSGQWLHHRVEQELAKANHNKEVNLRRGKAGAEARYGKKDAPTMLEASLVHSSSPSPSPSHKEEDTCARWREQADAFWKAYPKRKGKGNVEKWFKANKPTDDLLAHMLHKIEELKTTSDWKKENGQFIPMPYTWLNGKRWDDELQIVLPRQCAI